MPTAKQIDDACRAGLFCFYSNRQGILGAVAHRTAEITIKGRVWVQRECDQAWEYVDAGSITITSEKVRRRKMPQGKGRSGAPSHLKLAKKGGGKPSPDSKSEGAAEATPASRTPQASFTRSGPGKQDELPTMSTSERRSPEIEEAAERWEETKLAKAKAVKAHQEADDILVTVMRKKKRTHYSRSTFGAVTVPEPKIHAKFAREKQEPAKKARKK